MKTVAAEKRRNLNYNKGSDEVPKILTRLSNYLLQGKITPQEYNSLISGCRVYLQYWELTKIADDQERIDEMIQDLKEQGLI